MDTVLKGRPANGPAVEGYALVCPNSIQGWAALDVDTGDILEVGHPHQGDNVKDKILVAPCSRGSLAWASNFFSCQQRGNGVKAFVFTRMDSKCGSAVALTDRPCVADFDADTDPCKLIQTGDYVRVDGDAGTVTILKRANE